MIWLWLALATYVGTGGGGFVAMVLLASGREDPLMPLNPMPLLVGVAFGTLTSVALIVRFVMWLNGWN